MAEGPDPIAKLKEQVTCPVCLDIFTQSKLLVCTHTFCMYGLHSIIYQLI